MFHTLLLGCVTEAVQSTCCLLGLASGRF